MAIAAFVATPAGAETSLEYYERCQQQRAVGYAGAVDAYKERVDVYKGSVDTYKGSVDNLYGKVQEAEQVAIQHGAEANQLYQAALQKEADVKAVEARLAYREGYVPYSGGCYMVNGYFPYGYWPSYWSAVPIGPIYGRANCNWNHHKQSPVVNNITVNKTVVVKNHDDFRRDVHRGFDSHHAAPIASASTAHRQSQPQTVQSAPQPRAVAPAIRSNPTPAIKNSPVLTPKLQPQMQARSAPTPAPHMMQPQVRSAPAPRPQPQMQARSAPTPAPRQNYNYSGAPGGRRR
ncbi:MAG TPA: hypothetical protein VK254_01560 [Candidatus Bathyarchaeia archaeon]|nr:hypothetical protein [Candidatus Bathyarchaeia archaeon]